MEKIGTILVPVSILTADQLTFCLTAFLTFNDLISAGGNYQPTLRVKVKEDGSHKCSAEYALAELYDSAQVARGDKRRADRV